MFDVDMQKYLKLHGVESKSDGYGGLWLKFPVACKALNTETYECKVHGDRPEICRRYPQKESPFIPIETCSLLKSKLDRLKA